jgi:hypothetical protein
MPHLSLSLNTNWRGLSNEAANSIMSSGSMADRQRIHHAPDRGRLLRRSPVISEGACRATSLARLAGPALAVSAEFGGCGRALPSGR